MTNQQLYLSIGLPCLLVLLNATIMLYLFSRLEARIDRLDTKLDVKTEALSSKIDSKVDTLRIELRNELGGKLDKLASDYTNFYGEQSRHDERLSALERQRPPQA